MIPTAEDIDENTLHFGIRNDDLECLLDSLWSCSSEDDVS